MMRTPSVLLVLALLLGQLAAVAHLTHDATDADLHGANACEHCLQAAHLTGGALPADSGHPLPRRSTTAPLPFVVAVISAHGLERYSIRGPPAFLR